VPGAIRPEQSSLLVLRSEGHTLAAIAGLLYLNPSSVGTLLARAEAAFRKEYVSRYGEERASN
jgi:RNA polymerase sigma-70 factor (ECF subfamily)